MLIQEAIKSGKYFKRFNSTPWIKIEDGELIGFYDCGSRFRFYLTKEDILAHDWVVKDVNNIS